MYDLFMTYWAIGVCFVVIYQITSFLYVISQGDKYIYNEHPAPTIIIILMNLLLSVFYPLFIILLILDTLNNNQQKKRTSYHIKEIQKKLDALEQKEKEEKQHE